MRRGASQRSQPIHHEITPADLILDLGCADQQQQGVHPRGVEKAAQPGQRRGWPVQPEGIAIHHQERRGPEPGKRLAHATAGFQRLGLELDAGAGALAFGHGRHDARRLPVGVDHGLLHAGVE